VQKNTKVCGKYACYVRQDIRYPYPSLLSMTAAAVLIDILACSVLILPTYSLRTEGGGGGGGKGGGGGRRRRRKTYGACEAT